MFYPHNHNKVSIFHGIRYIKIHKSKIWLFVFFDVSLHCNTADMAQLVEQRIRNA